MQNGIKYAVATLALIMLTAVAYAQSKYRIQPGDIITVEVLEDNSLNRSLQVLPDGTITVPFAGSVRSAGRTVEQVTAAITTGLAPQFANRPTVFVSVRPAPEEPIQATEAEEETIRIYITGEVNEPGPHDVQEHTTFLQAISLTGGLTRFAATKRLQLRRTNPDTGKPTLITVNYRALSRGASLNQDVPLLDGDVILVPERRLFE
jgi:polysaccharide export outer membrane protein